MADDLHFSHYRLDYKALAIIHQDELKSRLLSLTTVSLTKMGKRNIYTL
jgi:hypothetical protein